MDDGDLESELDKILQNPIGQQEEEEEEEEEDDEEQDYQSASNTLFGQYEITFRRSITKELEGKPIAIVDEFILTEGPCEYQHYQLEIQQNEEEEGEANEEGDEDPLENSDEGTQTEDIEEEISQQPRIEFPDDGRVVKQHRKLQLKQVLSASSAISFLNIRSFRTIASFYWKKCNSC